MSMEGWERHVHSIFYEKITMFANVFGNDSKIDYLCVFDDSVRLKFRYRRLCAAQRVE